jgi:hypothetical protein
MAASALTAAYLAGGSGNEGSMLGMDPATASAMPDLQLGQALMQGGLSTAPASPWQAVARLAQTGAGSFIKQGAISDLAKAYSGSTEQMAQVFDQVTKNPNNIVSTMLRSDNPVVRMQGWQMAQKAGLQVNEPQDVRPGNQVVQPGAPGPAATNTNPRDKTAIAVQDAGRLQPTNPAGAAAVGQSVTKSNAMEGGYLPPPTPLSGPAPPSGPPRLAGTVSPTAAVQPPGALPGYAETKAANAGAEAAAKAPFEPGGEGVVNTPTGPQTIPITAATRAKMQPNLGAPSPSAAIQPPEPGAGAAAASGAPAGQTGKDQARVPQPPGPSSVVSNGAPGVSGKPLANPAIDPAVAADTKELANDRELATKGQQDMATVRAIQDFLPTVQTGWSAESKLEAARILKAGGTSDAQIQDLLNTNVASGQILQKKFLELSAAAARGMGAREPGSVISMFAKAYPNLGTDQDAVKLQTNALYMDRLRQQQLAQQKTNFLNDSINGVQSTGQYRGLKGFNEQFNQTNPAENYLTAAESMSGAPQGWSRVKDPAQRQSVIDLIPAGTHYIAPDGTMRIHP